MDNSSECQANLGFKVVWIVQLLKAPPRNYFTSGTIKLASRTLHDKGVAISITRLGISITLSFLRCKSGD